MADPKKPAAATAASKKKVAKPSEPKTTAANATVVVEPATTPSAPRGYWERFIAWPMWLRIAALVVTGLVIIGLLWWVIAAIWPNQPTGSSGAPDGTAANALVEPTGTVEPAVTKGVTSWTAWGKASLKNSDMEASMVEAHGEEYHKYFALMVENEKKGKSYKKLFQKGTRFINCDYNVVNDGHYTFFWDTLDKDTWMLTFPDGTPAVKMICGNTVIFRKSETKKPGTTPHPKSVKGPDKTHGAARQKLRDNNAVRTPTPGYTGGGSGSSGSAEQIAAEQKRTSGSTTNNGQVGHTGATPGTNSSGETNNGGGASDTSLPGGVSTPVTGDTGPPD